MIFFILSASFCIINGMSKLASPLPSIFHTYFWRSRWCAVCVGLVWYCFSKWPNSYYTIIRIKARLVRFQANIKHCPWSSSMDNSISFFCPYNKNENVLWILVKDAVLSENSMRFKTYSNFWFGIFFFPAANF